MYVPLSSDKMALKDTDFILLLVSGSELYTQKSPEDSKFYQLPASFEYRDK